MSTKPVEYLNAPPFMLTMGRAAPVAHVCVTVHELVQLLAASKKHLLPEGKLFQLNDEPLQRFEWFGQLEGAIDSSSLTDDVKLTYLKTLGTGRAKTTVAEFVY